MDAQVPYSWPCISVDVEPARYEEPTVFFALLKMLLGTSLVAQWIRIRSANAGDMGSTPGPGRSHMQQSN